MEMANALTAAAVRPREVVETFVHAAGPVRAASGGGAVGQARAIRARWPTPPGPASTQPWRRRRRQEYVVQVNGKVRHRFQARGRAGRGGAAGGGEGRAQVAALLDGKTIVKEIAIPGRLANFVVRD